MLMKGEVLGEGWGWRCGVCTCLFHDLRHCLVRDGPIRMGIRLWMGTSNSLSKYLFTPIIQTHAHFHTTPYNHVTTFLSLILSPTFLPSTHSLSYFSSTNAFSLLLSSTPLSNNKIIHHS